MPTEQPMNDSPEAIDASATPEALSAEDAIALDALIDAEFDLDRVPASLRQRAAKALDLLNLLDAPAALTSAGAANVADRLMARLQSIGSTPAAHSEQGAFTPADAAALDALVDAQWNPARVGPEHRERAGRIAALAGLVDSGASLGSPAALADRTLQLIDLVDESQAPISIGAANPWRRRLWDLVSVAAMGLIGVSVLWPIMAGVRQKSLDQNCSVNLQTVATAMGAYANDNQMSVPVAVAAFGPSRWWDVNESRPQANSANLFALPKNRYLRLADLACPGNASAPRGSCPPAASDWRSLPEVSYSYQVMTGRAHPRWNGDRRIILADRSPAVLRAVRGESVSPLENSPNHGALGQHVLYTDGSIQWLQRPEVPGDPSIWVPNPKVRITARATANPDGSTTVMLTGYELPASDSDVFLGP